MSRLETIFKNNKKILSLYFTAGYPNLSDTVSILKYTQEAGVDLVEIGMPFSDPLADGPVIQASGLKALQNGMSLEKLFEQLEGFREEVSIPVVLMGYINPVLQFGMEEFLQSCEKVGIDAVILPDLPLDIYEKEYKSLFQKHRVEFVALVTPETTKERLEEIDRIASGFIYAVSSSSTTGSNQDWEKLDAYFMNLRDSKLKNPVMTGFGVKDKASFENASRYTNGAIIGTAFIKQLSENKDNLEEAVKNFVGGILEEN